MLQESLILIGFIAVIAAVLIALAIFLKKNNNKVIEMNFVNPVSYTHLTLPTISCV